MASDKKAVACANILVAFCKEQIGCQNCAFRGVDADRWECHIGEPELWDLKEVASNMQAKKRKRRYL